MFTKVLSKIFRNTKDFKGKQRIYKKIDKILRCNSSIVEKIGGIRYELYTNDIIQRKLLYEGSYQENIKDIITILGGGKKSGVFWDVGANMGSISLPVAKSLKGWEVYCFEPSPSLLYKLHNNLVLNENILENVFIIQAALGSEIGISDFHISNENENSGVGSLGKYHNTRRKGVKTLKYTGDEAVNNNLAKEPDIIKIDVEGFEYEVLIGMLNIMDKKDIAIILELSPYRLEKKSINAKDIINELKGKRFQVYDERRKEVPKEIEASMINGEIVAVKGYYEKIDWT